MLEAVDRRVEGRVAQAVVGRDVEHPGAAVDEVGDQRRGLGVRVADRREVAGVDRLDVGRLQAPLHPVLGGDLDEPPAGVAAGGDRAELEGRVAVDQLGELRAGEAGRPEDVDTVVMPAAARPAASSASRTRATAASISSSVSVRPGSASSSRRARLTRPSPTCSPA